MDMNMLSVTEETKDEEIIEAKKCDDLIMELDHIEKELMLICSVITNDFKSYITGNRFKNRIK